ncbi:hypothetical protein IKG33_03590 [Candidatus Saccharibacteria bacterium]|nr:hypothetical protein [Candidatus Saccharibacteria bacterium]
MYVVNDLHGFKNLTDLAVNSIGHMRSSNVLILNGDIAGARGPIMNNLVRIFYEVRRGETDEAELVSAVQEIVGEEVTIPRRWIYDTIHAGLFRKLMADRYEKFAECLNREILDVLVDTLDPLSKAANERGVQLFYLPGNGEITPNDFLAYDCTIEETVAPEKRFYQRLAADGYFKQFNIEFIPYATKLGTVALISANLLDLCLADAVEKLKEGGLYDSRFTKVIVHYPPAISPLGKTFAFWTPNKMDVKRAEALRKILVLLRLEKEAKIYFGHIHLGGNDPRMDAFPSHMGFNIASHSCTWVKPGTVIKI